MNCDIEEFVESLSLFVESLLRSHDALYSTTAVQIIDARNHIFIEKENARTDESVGIFALSDLCCMNDDLDYVPNNRKMRAIARDYWT